MAEWGCVSDWEWFWSSAERRMRFSLTSAVTWRGGPDRAVCGRGGRRWIYCDGGGIALFAVMSSSHGIYSISLICHLQHAHCRNPPTHRLCPSAPPYPIPPPHPPDPKHFHLRDPPRRLRSAPVPLPQSPFPISNIIGSAQNGFLYRDASPQAKVAKLSRFAKS